MATDDPAARWPHYREDDFIIRNFGCVANFHLRPFAVGSPAMTNSTS
jgi:hypothetical protein